MRVLIEPKAQKQFDRLPDVLQARVRDAIASLHAYPNVRGVKALKGSLKGSFRLRIGDYRVVFQLGSGIVRVTQIDDRKDVYGRDSEVRMARSIRDHVTKIDTASSRTVDALPFMRRSIGAKLRAMRLSAGMTQAEMANKIDRSPSTVGLAEQGRISVSAEYIEDVLRASGAGRPGRRNP